MADDRVGMLAGRLAAHVRENPLEVYEDRVRDAEIVLARPTIVLTEPSMCCTSDRINERPPIFVGDLVVISCAELLICLPARLIDCTESPISKRSSGSDRLSRGC